MSEVLCTSYEPTGRYKLVKGFFGPKVYMEVIIHTFDTNSGFDDPDQTIWTKAKSKDLGLLTERVTTCL